MHLPPQGGNDIATKPIAFSGGRLQVNVANPNPAGIADKVCMLRNNATGRLYRKLRQAGDEMASCQWYTVRSGNLLLLSGSPVDLDSFPPKSSEPTPLSPAAAPVWSVLIATATLNPKL